MSAIPAREAGELRLDRLPPHGCAVVSRMEAEGDEAGRLKAMGVCMGRRIEMVRAGDPLILRVLGVRIGLSARLASRIFVRACDPAGCPGGGGMGS